MLLCGENCVVTHKSRNGATKMDVGSTATLLHVVVAAIVVALTCFIGAVLIVRGRNIVTPVSPIASCGFGGLLAARALEAAADSRLGKPALLLFAAAPVCFFAFSALLDPFEEVVDSKKDDEDHGVVTEPEWLIEARAALGLPEDTETKGKAVPEDTETKSEADSVDVESSAATADAPTPTVIAPRLPLRCLVMLAARLSAWSAHCFLDGWLLGSAQSEPVLLALALPASLSVCEAIVSLIVGEMTRSSGVTSSGALLASAGLVAACVPAGAALSAWAAGAAQGSRCVDVISGSSCFPTRLGNALPLLRSLAGGMVLYMAVFDMAPSVRPHGRRQSLRWLGACLVGCAAACVAPWLQGLAMAGAPSAVGVPSAATMPAAEAAAGLLPTTAVAAPQTANGNTGSGRTMRPSATSAGEVTAAEPAAKALPVERFRGLRSGAAWRKVHMLPAVAVGAADSETTDAEPSAKLSMTTPEPATALEPPGMIVIDRLLKIID